MGKSKECLIKFITEEELENILAEDFNRLLNDERNYSKEELTKDFKNMYKEVINNINNIAIRSLKTYLAFDVYPYKSSGNVLKYNFNYRTFTDESLKQTYIKQHMHIINIKSIINNSLDKDETSIQKQQKDKKLLKETKTHKTLSFLEHRDKCPKYNLYSNTRNRSDFTVCLECLLKTNDKTLGHGIECCNDVFYKY